MNLSTIVAGATTASGNGDSCTPFFTLLIGSIRDQYYH